MSDHSYDLEDEYCSDMDHQVEHVPAERWNPVFRLRIERSNMDT